MFQLYTWLPPGTGTYHFGRHLEQKTTKPKSTIFEKQYLTIHRFVEEIGWIEIGRHEMILAFVWAYDLDDTV